MVDKALLQTAKSLLNEAKSRRDIDNWFFKHKQFLREFGVLTGDQTEAELKAVAKTQIDQSRYMGALATLRKLHDLHRDCFYNYNNYELITLSHLKKIISQH